MKNRLITSFIYIVLGVLLILIPTKLFPVCSSGNMKMSCYYTARAELGLGALVILLGAAAILSANDGIRGGLSIAQFGIGILVLLYPTKLIGLCKMSDMKCRIQTLPALIVVGVLLIILSAVNAVYLIGKEWKLHDKPE